MTHRARLIPFRRVRRRRRRCRRGFIRCARVQLLQWLSKVRDSENRLSLGGFRCLPSCIAALLSTTDRLTPPIIIIIVVVHIYVMSMCVCLYSRSDVRFIIYTYVLCVNV